MGRAWRSPLAGLRSGRYTRCMSEQQDSSAFGTLAVRPLRRTEYDQLVSSGVFAGERLELLRGRLLPMSPQGVAHMFVVRRLYQLLFLSLQGKATVLSQMPLAISGESEPEPDVCVVPLSPDDYASAKPERALLVVEVADSTLLRDASVKAQLYAECGVPEYWMIDVKSRVARVHRGPVGGGWTSVNEHGTGATLSPQAFPDVAVPLDAILPPP